MSVPYPVPNREVNSAEILKTLATIQANLATANQLLGQLASKPQSAVAPSDPTLRLGNISSTLTTSDGRLESIDGKVPALVGGSVPVTGPLTDEELRASAVPVSGTVVATGPLTDAQLRASPVPVSGTVAVTGVATAANQVTGNASLASLDEKVPKFSLDSFSRLRVSEPAFRFDAQMTYQVNTDVWDTKTVTSGTVAHNSTMRAATLTAAASAGSQAILQSHYHVPYTPGRSQLAFVTFILGATPASGVTRRVGYYGETADAGVYLEQTSGGLTLNLRTGGTGYANQQVAQASWNIDPLTGSGPSGITLDPTKVQILVISLQALYVGRVVVAFDIGGELVPVHQFLHANLITAPYITQASLPVHYSIRTTAAAGGTMTAICASVMSEGGEPIVDMQGRIFSASNGNTSIGVTTRRPVLSVTVKQLLNALSQNTVVVPIAAEAMARTNDAFIEVVRNGTLTGASFADVDAALSGCQKDVAATAISGGQVIESFFVPASNTFRTSSEKTLGGKAFLCYSQLLAAGDIVSVVATSRSGTSDIHGAIKWKEIR